MRTKTFLPGVAAGFAVMLILAASNSRSLAQEGPVALAGQVRSTAEGLMEGVVVSAKKTVSTVTVSVMSDAQGQYSFPRNRLAPGQYSLSIRAVGYEMDDPGVVEITWNKAVTTNLTRGATEILHAATVAESDELWRVRRELSPALQLIAPLTVTRRAGTLDSPSARTRIR